MNAERMVGQDEPLMIAWNAYKATEEYANSRQWAEYKAHLDGSLWAAFCAGYAARDDELRKQEPPPTAWMTAVKDRIRWLSRSLEKALATPIPTPSQQDAIKAVDDMESLLATDPKFATYFDRISVIRDFILARPDAPIPPTVPEGWQLVPKVGTQGCMPCSDGDKPPHDAEPVKDDEWVQCYLYTLLDEAKRRGGMFPQTSEEQDDDSKAIVRVADMVRFYGQQGYPKQDAIAKLQAIRERNRK